MQKIIADLHSHTTASDGELSPQALVEAAAKAGLKALSITDHDTVAALPEALEHAEKLGIEIVPGCELTAYEGEIELHILAYFMDCSEGTPLADLFLQLQQARRERGILMAQKLRAAGFSIEDEDVFAAAGKAASIGRPHVAAALIKRGHARTFNQAIINFLVPGKVGYVPKMRLTPDAIFQAVHAAGGICLLAHPGVVPHDELIAPLFQRGMDGVEALYLRHSEVNRRFYAGLANRYEKLISGGSDFHGPRVRALTALGAGGVDLATLNSLRQAAERRRLQTH